jgi:hypothetical protein
MNELLDTFYQSMGNMISSVNKEKTKIEQDYKNLQKKFRKQEEEFTRYKSVSLINKLDKELFEKNNEISFLKKKIEKFEKNQPHEDEDEDEDEEIEVNTITIKKKNYYITQDIHSDVYEKLEDGSVGIIIGKYINGRLVRAN